MGQVSGLRKFTGHQILKFGSLGGTLVEDKVTSTFHLKGLYDA